MQRPAISWSPARSRVEQVDFHFADDGAVTEVYHSCPSDCDIKYPLGLGDARGTVCEMLRCGDGAAVPASDIMRAIADSTGISLLYFDVKANKAADLAAMGRGAADALISLFAAGYTGNVLMGCGSIAQAPALCGAAAASVAKSAYDGRVAFTIGGTTDVSNPSCLIGGCGTPAEAMQTLVGISPFRALSAGTSAVMPTTQGMLAASRLGAENYRAGVLVMPPMMWTFDTRKRFEQLLGHLGAQAITTNEPHELLSVVRERGYKLASFVNTPFAPASSDDVRTQLAGSCSLMCPT